MEIKISAIACAIPSKRYEISNLNYHLLTEKERQRFVKVVGIENRRWGPKNYCSSDYCYAAAEKILKDLNIERQDVGIVVYVTQTPDYITPATACSLQTKLGLSNGTIAFDVNLGCSGFTYGLMIVSSIMKNLNIKHGLLLAGDSPSKMICPDDKTTAMLFSDAGSACLLSLDAKAKPFLYDCNSDGTGAGTIMVKSGYRNGFDPKPNEIGKTDFNLDLDGAAIMDFTVSQIPISVKKVVENARSNNPNLEIDNYFFHQANKVVNDTVASRLGLKSANIPSTLREYGNTSSASIPLTMLSLGQEYFNTKRNIILCGFGVGLSWATILAETENLKILDLVELD